MRGYGNGFGQFAVTDNLDGLFQAFQKSALLQKFRGDTVPGIERLKDFQTNQRIVGLEYIVEAPLHGQSLYQLVLTTLESGPNRATGTGFLSFHTPAGRASLACGVASANPFPAFPGPRTGDHLMFHHWEYLSVVNTIKTKRRRLAPLV